jgi:hypothetical protein
MWWMLARVILIVAAIIVETTIVKAIAIIFLVAISIIRTFSCIGRLVGATESGLISQQFLFLFFISPSFFVCHTGTAITVIITKTKATTLIACISIFSTY